ncbi:Ger(x)C family spore germination protein [Sutcliffiella halmapala]|uniref:Ger(x)C family spore germination protein n=1 Tax=Sutcliffiella halmapala TaxID=79882 RepID=UPI0009951C8E|nr:Ger(x)C family spore germination protein [Sutcliffiella halmapala]
MKNISKIILYFSIFTLLLLLTSCGDIKEIHQLSYVTAVGVDYKDNQYHGYLQMMGFDTQSKDGGGGEPKVWVSETIGDTFDAALSEAYNTAQDRILWAHVNAIVLSESAIQEGFQKVFDVLTRYYELRLTPWIFGTSDPIDEIFSTQSFFNQSALETILHQPTGTFKQSSKIRPLNLQKFARELYEPTMTTYVPSLKVNASHWKVNMETDPKLSVNGGFFIQNELYKGFYTLDELKGLQWIAPETKRASIVVPDEQQSGIIVVIEDLKVNIETNSNEQHTPKFSVHMKLKGFVSNRNDNHIVKLKAMEEAIKKSITKEVNELYELGLKKGTDFLCIEHVLYREHNKKWLELSERDEVVLQAGALENVSVEVNIEHTGAIKNRSLNLWLSE